MNCKPGDLAIIVRSAFPEFLGSVVEVLREYRGNNFRHDGPGWVVLSKGEEMHAADSHLRPIRPNDGEDEMIRIAGKPKAKREIYDTYVRVKAPS